MYLLNTCAACAAPLALDAPRCVRCHSRYCNAICQHDHWRRGHSNVLGLNHPTTVGIVRSIKLAFDEQLDWTLDDFPGPLREFLYLYYT